ncbi:MAG: hypothetical protein OHK0028_17300 [Deltaproteobacteria bacterium]
MGLDLLERKAAPLFDEAGERFGAQAGSLIGSKVAFRKKNLVRWNPEEVAVGIRKKAAVLLLDSVAGSGKAGVVFRVSEAVLFAATLLMMPASQIAELVESGEMGQDLCDAFTEVANILYGSLDDLTVRVSPEKGKMRNDGVALVDLSAGGDFRAVCPSGSAFAAEFTVDVAGFEPGPAYLVLEDSLLSALFDIPLPPPDAARDVPPAPVGNRSVLLFGKDEAIRSGIVQFLKSLGVETKATASADQAVAWIESGPVLILADFSGARTGEEDRLCRAAAEKGRGIPVVGLSDRPTRETVLRARRAGVRAFLVHPFTPGSLREKIGPYLDAGGNAGTGRTRSATAWNES